VPSQIVPVGLKGYLFGGLFLALFLPTSMHAGAEQKRGVIAGRATAEDGDTLLVDGNRIDVRALHAPGPDEPGGKAATEMAALAVYGEHVVCHVVDTDEDGGLLGDCTMSSDGADFAEVMIRAGHADHCPSGGRPDLSAIPGNGLTLPDGCK